MITFRGTGSPAVEISGGTIILTGAGVALDYDATGLPRLTFSGGGGGISGSGTNGTITKWTGTSSVGNSIMTESGSTITVANTLNATTLGGTLSTAAQANVTSLGTLTALTVSGLLNMTASAAQISGGATSLSLRNSANSADNLLVADAGGVTFRAGLSGITTIGMSGVLTSSLTTGTAPFTVASQTVVVNLNADLLDGLNASAFLGTAAISGTTGTIAKFASASTVGNSIMTESGATITVTSTLNATTLGGTLSTAAQTNITSVGTLTALTVSGLLNLTASAAQISGGATSLSLRNSANNADNLLLTDAGLATFRNTVTLNGSVTQPTADSYFGHKAVHWEDYSVATATFVTVNLPAITGSSTLLQSGWSYRFELVTLGTTSATGAVYLTYLPAASSWTVTKVATNAETSNWPLLRLSVAGTGVEVYHNHGSTYSIKVRVEAFNHGNGFNNPELHGLESRYSVVSGVATVLADINHGGHILFSADNSKDLGASAATRPRSGYFGTSLVLGTDPTTAYMLRVGGQAYIKPTGLAAAAGQTALWVSGSVQSTSGASATGLIVDTTLDGTNFPIGASFVPGFNVSANSQQLYSMYVGAGTLAKSTFTGLTWTGLSVSWPNSVTGAGSLTTATSLSIAGGADGLNPTGTRYGLYINSISSGIADNYAIFTNAGKVSFGGDTIIGTLGTFDSTATPVTDYSLVYNGSKWVPRLINVSVATSGAVGATSLPDGTQGAFVNPQNAPPASSPAVPRVTGTSVTAGYRCNIVGMSGNSGAIPANQLYAIDWAKNVTFYSGRFSITSGTATLTAGSATFLGTAADIGRWVAVATAGPASTNNILYAKITASASTTSVTISVNASNNATSVNGTLTSATDTTLPSGYVYRGFDQRATSTVGSSSTVVASAPGWAVNQWQNMQIVFLNGANAGAVRRVLSNTTTIITLDPTYGLWSSAQSIGDQFAISQLFSSADTFVHAGLAEADVYWYRFRTVSGSSTWISADYGPNTIPTAGATVSGVSYVNAFGLVVASQIAVVNLAAISGAITGLTASSIISGSIVTSQFQSSVARTGLDSTVDRVYTSGSTLYLQTGGTPNITNVLLGNYTILVGSTTPRTNTGPYSSNTPSVTISSSTGGAWVAASLQPTITSDITASLPSFDTNYTVFGSLVTSTTTTPASVTGFSSCTSRVRLEYQTTSGGAWTDTGEAASYAISPGGSTNTQNWSVIVSIPGTPTALNFRLTYEITLTCTKVLSGQFTCSGALAATAVTWSSFTGTQFTRRGLQLTGAASKPHISMTPITTAPTTSQVIEGEMWYMGSTTHALQLYDGTQIVNIGAANTSREGVIKLSNHLGGTYLVPRVEQIGVASGGSVAVSSGVAPVANQILRATSATNANWQDIPGTPSGNPGTRTPWGWFAPGTGTVQGFINLPATPTVSGTAALSAQTDDYYTSLTTGAVATNRAGIVTTTFTICRLNYLPTIYIRIRTPAAFAFNVTGQRVWLGLTSVAQSANSDTASGSVVMFRINSSSTTAANIVGVVRDGTTQQATGTLATLAVSTTYLLKIRMASTSDARFVVDTGSETSLSANTPAATTDLGVQADVMTTSANAAAILVAFMQGEDGA